MYVIDVYPCVIELFTNCPINKLNVSEDLDIFINLHILSNQPILSVSFQCHFPQKMINATGFMEGGTGIHSNATKHNISPSDVTGVERGHVMALRKFSLSVI